jgi:regulator of replication initiation timing
MTNTNFEKYLKYKAKYLDLKTELQGGNNDLQGGSVEEAKMIIAAIEEFIKSTKNPRNEDYKTLHDNIKKNLSTEGVFYDLDITDDDSLKLMKELAKGILETEHKAELFKKKKEADDQVMQAIEEVKEEEQTKISLQNKRIADEKDKCYKKIKEVEDKLKIIVNGDTKEKIHTCITSIDDNIKKLEEEISQLKTNYTTKNKQNIKLTSEIIYLKSQLNTVTSEPSTKTHVTQPEIQPSKHVKDVAQKVMSGELNKSETDINKIITSLKGAKTIAEIDNILTNLNKDMQTKSIMSLAQMLKKKLL